MVGSAVVAVVARRVVAVVAVAALGAIVVVVLDSATVVAVVAVATEAFEESAPDGDGAVTREHAGDGGEPGDAGRADHPPGPLGRMRTATPPFGSESSAGFHGVSLVALALSLLRAGRETRETVRRGVNEMATGNQLPWLPTR